ncbi:hypothetical protein NCS52_01186200 [Fusarium sp. LHS14.1]|nr:hypothetical protein NCS52_01186200 [Fusarium sp. LHS14.1]
MTRGIPDILASQASALRIPSLETCFRNNDREEVLTQAHVAIKVFEMRFDVFKRMVSVEDRIRHHSGLPPRAENEVKLESHTRCILRLDRSVDKCLFGDRDVNLIVVRQFDHEIMGGNEHMGTDMATLKTYIASVERSLPRELRNELAAVANQPISQPQDVIHIDVPPLASAYSTTNNRELRGKARVAIKGLEDLLCRAKDLVLRSLPRLGSRDNSRRLVSEIYDLLDNGGDVALLRGYVNKILHTKKVIVTSVFPKPAVTGFMADNFDHATSRLASRLKAQISILEQFAVPRDARLSNAGEGQGRDLTVTTKQSIADKETLLSLHWRSRAILDDLKSRGNPEVENVLAGMDFDLLTDHAKSLPAIAVKVEVDFQLHDGVCVNSLGRDFVATVLQAAHDLVKADIATLRQLNSNMERMTGLSPAEAAVRFPTMDNYTGFMDFMSRHKDATETTRAQVLSDNFDLRAQLTHLEQGYSDRFI